MNDRVQAIMAEVDRRKPNRLVIDALSEVRMLAKDPLRYRRRILSLKEYAPENCTVLLLDHRQQPLCRPGAPLHRARGGFDEPGGT